MQYRRLGNSGLEVPTVIFGAWAIGGWFWGGTDDEQAIEAIREAVDSGITCIDTAPMYGCGHSETVVGKAVRDIRDQVLIATKCGLRWDRSDGEYYFKTQVNNTPVEVYRVLKKDSIIEECENSLKRLGVDVIDLYQCHWMDKTTPIEETMEALVRLKDQGKIRAIGVSNFSPEAMEECLKHGPLVSDQPKYNLLERKIEADVLPFCRVNGIGTIVYSPLAQGLLTGKVTLDRKFPEDDFRQVQPWFQPRNRARVLEALTTIEPIAEAHGITLGQLAIAWTVAQPGVTAAIVGARNGRQVRENAAAADVNLNEGDLKSIRQVFEKLGGPEK